VVATAPSAANGFAGLTPGTKVVVVQPGQCLSVIAAEHLAGNWQTGDSEIHALNVGRIQPDGRALTDDHWIYPGWVLVMPDTAVNTLVVPGQARSSSFRGCAGRVGAERPPQLPPDGNHDRSSARPHPGPCHQPPGRLDTQHQWPSRSFA
jgi:hypothetical protein